MAHERKREKLQKQFYQRSDQKKKMGSYVDRSLRPKQKASGSQTMFKKEQP